MTGAGFRPLFAWEWRRVAQTPLFWLVQAALVASMVWAALDTAALHHEQDAAAARTLAADAAHRASVRERFDAYRTPMTLDAPAIPYWQDPSNVSGFSQYFVAPHAVKPHLPLSPLAVGTSDLAPSRVEVKLATLFGIDERYDFENPRGLALGRFDLGFVLALLLPMALILLYGLLVSFERDRGMIRLLAAQATPPRTWLAARIAAVAAWAVPVTLAGLVLALALAGARIGAAIPELAAALLLVLAYVALWTGIALLVLSRLPGAAAALGTLAAIWAVLTLGLPMAGAAITSAIAPPPASSGWIDAQRRTTDAIEMKADAIIAQGIAQRPDLAGASDRMASLDHATKLTFLIPETEHRLATLHLARLAYARDQRRNARLAGFLAPPLGLSQALATLAGTDGARQYRFEAQARAYQLRLRGLLYPLVQREAARPTPQGTTRGRYSLSDTNILPPFALRDTSAAQRAGSVMPFAGWLFLLGLALGALGLRRATRWQP
ncbi:DUF3526 domain-containing protein [uncultured Sphingomonas sp.]|uniref:DUF3526 domain-containing protein n=1 Tax=uncultured Sphingomonas sp. TaxID=158754 RepID=UPI0026186632|nr:DUF3526 domain-containing protein [uncultured Sphingomonas sp.]